MIWLIAIAAVLCCFAIFAGGRIVGQCDMVLENLKKLEEIKRRAELRELRK